MHEIQRQQYLNALGIDSYMPRVLLPWAPAPRQVALPEVLEEGAQEALPERAEAARSISRAEASVSPTPISETPTAAPVGHVLRDMGLDSKPRSVPAPTDKVSLTRERSEPVKAVHLHLWRPAADYLIIDDCPPGTALPTQRLLANILRALTGELPALGNPERMRCPINDQLAQSYTQEDVRRDLHTWFAETYAKAPAAQVWLMGEAASYFLPEPSHYSDCLWTRSSLALGESEMAREIQALILPSLSEILQQSAYKPRLWQAIKPSHPQ